LLLEIPAKDKRSAIELSIDRAHSYEPPTLQPPPDLSYDRRVLQATIVHHKLAGGSGKGSRSSRNLVQTLSVKYTCFKDGVSVVVVTIHVLAHKPIDIAWRKRCVEPKVRVGKAMTAPQAIGITIGVCLLIAVCLCGVWIMCGQDGKSANYATYQGIANGTYAGEDELEMAVTRGPPPKPSKLGAAIDNGPEGEVTFH